MKNCCIATALLIVLAACKKDVETSQIPNTQPEITVTKSDHLQAGNDTLVIDKRCAVDYWASEAKMLRMQKEGGDDYYTAADDAAWYTAESNNYLDSIKFPTIRTKGYRYVRFQKADGNSVYLDTDTIQGITGIYFFDPAKDPKEADITGIWDSFKEYFGEE